MPAPTLVTADAALVVTASGVVAPKLLDPEGFTCEFRTTASVGVPDTRTSEGETATHGR